MYEIAAFVFDSLSFPVRDNQYQSNAVVVAASSVVVAAALVAILSSLPFSPYVLLLLLLLLLMLLLFLLLFTYRGIDSIQSRFTDWLLAAVRK